MIHHSHRPPQDRLDKDKEDEDEDEDKDKEKDEDDKDRHYVSWYTTRNGHHRTD